MYFAELSTIPKFCAVLNMEILVNVVDSVKQLWVSILSQIQTVMS